VNEHQVSPGERAVGGQVGGGEPFSFVKEVEHTQLAGKPGKYEQEENRRRDEQDELALE
jgi:hypothetical protein